MVLFFCVSIWPLGSWNLPALTFLTYVPHEIHITFIL